MTTAPASLDCRPYSVSEYHTLAHWFIEQGWNNPPNPSMLQRGMVTDHGAIFLFEDELVPVLGILFFVANPTNTNAEEYARHKGKSGLWSSVQKESLRNHLITAGWQNAGQHFNLIKAWDL
ncbi:MAG: hypothetical protein EBR79_04580 [Proteobacteria bacterium]|nr:hypothetical protein [Pseudomonadota bacterium]